jgi:hypothetical protein
VAAQGLGADPQKDACLCKLIIAPHKGTSTTQKYANIRKHIRTHILYLSISQTLTHTHTHAITHSLTHKQGTACKGRRYADLPACKKMRREHKAATTSVKPKSTYRVATSQHFVISTRAPKTVMRAVKQG